MVHFILLTIILLAFSNYRGKNLLKASFFLLAIFAILRYNFGNDYRAYMENHTWIRNGMENPFNGEISFYYLNKFTPNFYLLVAITSVFFIYVIYKLIASNLDGLYVQLALVIFLINPYLFLMNLSAIRQCIAMCIFIIATKYIQKRNLLKYLLLILLAVTFHTSALILFPVYFIVNGDDMNKVQTTILIVGILFLLIEGAVVTQIIEKGLGYLEISDYIYHFSQDMSNSLRATLLTGVYFLYVVLNLTNLKGYKLICGKLYLIGLIFGLLAFHFSMFTRIQMYFDIFSIVTIPAILEYHIENTTERWKKAINLYFFPALILLIYFARYYTFFANPMWSKFSTYHTIFEAIL